MACLDTTDVFSVITTLGRRERSKARWVFLVTLKSKIHSVVDRGLAEVLKQITLIF